MSTDKIILGHMHIKGHHLVSTRVSNNASIEEMLLTLVEKPTIVYPAYNSSVEIMEIYGKYKSPERLIYFIDMPEWLYNEIDAQSELYHNGEFDKLVLSILSEWCKQRKVKTEEPEEVEKF